MKKYSLLLAFLVCAIGLQAQSSKYQGARTWSTLSSLMGLSIEKAKTTLASHGMIVNETIKDDETGIEAFMFIPSNSTDPEYELPYALLCNAGKVVAVTAQFAYEEEETGILKQDIDKISRDMKQVGYTLNNQETKMILGSFGETEFDVYYFRNKLMEARIYHEKELVNFSISIGETKYQVMLNGE